MYTAQVKQSLGLNKHNTRVSFRGGAFAPPPPLALACPPWDFVLTVNQFKCFKSLTVMLCIINVNNSTHVLHAIMMFIVRDDS